MGGGFSSFDAKQPVASLLFLVEEKECAVRRQGEDSTSGETPCLHEGSNKEPFSAATAGPKPSPHPRGQRREEGSCSQLSGTDG